MIYRVDITLVHFLAVWYFLALRFSIYLAVRSEIWPSGFLFIQPSGFGLMDQFVLIENTGQIIMFIKRNL